MRSTPDHRRQQGRQPVRWPLEDRDLGRPAGGEHRRRHRLVRAAVDGWPSIRAWRTAVRRCCWTGNTVVDGLFPQWRFTVRDLHGWVAFAYNATTLAQTGAKFLHHPQSAGAAASGRPTPAWPPTPTTTSTSPPATAPSMPAAAGTDSWHVLPQAGLGTSPLNADLSANIVVNDWFSPYNELELEQWRCPTSAAPGVILIPGTNKAGQQGDQVRLHVPARIPGLYRARDQHGPFRHLAHR